MFFHSPMSLDVPSQITDSGQMKETETGRTEHTHHYTEHHDNFSNVHLSALWQLQTSMEKST